VDVAKALGGSFKLVTLAPKKTVREMIKLPKKTQKTRVQTNQKGQINTEHKPSTHKNTLGPTGL